MLELFDKKKYNKNMNNIIGYIKKNQKSFEESEFNEIDSLVLSKLSYLEIDAVSHKNKALKDLKNDKIQNVFNTIRMSRLNKKFLYFLSISKRFKNVKIKNITKKVNYIKHQYFIAITFELNKQNIYVAFRGTDSELLSWKETFDMMFSDRIPSQEQADKYLRRVTKNFSGNIFVGGHSKGGNLAIYSVLNQDIKTQEKIKKIYSHDGPGICNDLSLSPNYKLIRKKINKTLPQSSIIGLIFEKDKNYTVVKSKKIWFLQHDPYAWIVKKNKFALAKDITNFSKRTSNSIKKWVKSVSAQKRTLFVDTVFFVLSSSKAKSWIELKKSWKKELPNIVNSILNIEEDVAKQVKDMLKLFIKYYKLESKQRKKKKRAK